jgi:hypothetical protein
MMTFRIELRLPVAPGSSMPIDAPGQTYSNQYGNHD